MKSPLVSVIIPVYRVEQYIERCARSLFSQTLDGIEFLFVDDCSPDHSIEKLQRIIEEYQTRILEKHWIVRIERMTENSGQAAVRQYAIQIATGDYIIHCDSDDCVESNMMSEMWNLANNKNLDVVVCDYNHIIKTEMVIHKGMVNPLCNKDEFFEEVVSIFSSWSLCNKLIRRELYSGHTIFFPKEGMNVGEDMALVTQLLYYSKSVGYIGKPFYNYIDNRESISNKHNVSGIIDNYVQWIANICLLESFFKDKDIYDRMNKKLSYGVVFATDETLTRLESTGNNMHLLIGRLCVRLLCSNAVSSFGKRRVVRYMKRLFSSSLNNKIHQLGA